jgi:hypothetical protein
MCFSASASFTAAAVLVPLGLYSTHLARSGTQQDYVPLAMTPLFFGLQQFTEGLVWTGIDAGRIEPLTSLASVAFLFFAYCFWMIWIPFSAWSIAMGRESDSLARRLGWLWVVASLLGIAFFVPVLLHPPAVQPAVHATRRLLYPPSTIWHAFISTEPIGALAYWGFIVLPLLALSDRAVKLFGILILVSIFLTWLTYSQTFNSVWCFYSAILSIMVLWIVDRPRFRRT